MSPLRVAAERLSERLDATGNTLVLAESCTGGLAAAALVGRAGASTRLAGSFVTYQTASKAAWLGIPEVLLTDPGPVSPEVAAAMAAGVAVRTPHATLAAAITGHLGPGAPPGENGRLVVAVCSGAAEPSVVERRLPDAPADRAERQAAAAAILLDAVAAALTPPRGASWS